MLLVAYLLMLVLFVVFSEVFGITDFYNKTAAELEARRSSFQADSDQALNPKLEDDVITMPIRFERFGFIVTHLIITYAYMLCSHLCLCLYRREYPPQITPKMYLLEWSRKEKLDQPVYETVSFIRDNAMIYQGYKRYY